MDAMTPDTVVTRSRSRTRRWLVLLPCLLVAAAIVWTIWFFPHGAQKSTGQSQDGRNQAGQPIPVVTAEAQTKDVPIYLDGLGTVQAFNTVTIKPMVDGPLTAVTFQEGQDVRKGDVLAQIDPRTYQAALDSAVAKKAQDQAAAGQRPPRPGALPEAGVEQLHLGAAGGHAEGRGGAD